MWERGNWTAPVALATASALAGGGTVFVATNSSQTGPILAFAGAIIVALIAAYTASRRQSQQLRAESLRLERQLAHERELTYYEARREVLDGGADLLIKTLGEDLMFLDEDREPLGIPAWATKNYLWANHKLLIEGYGVRLLMWFNSGHEVVDLWHQARAAFIREYSSHDVSQPSLDDAVAAWLRAAASVIEFQRE